MPPQGNDAANVEDELRRIRAEVEAGNTDLRALRFWPLVERVKRDPGSIDAHADEIGAIDRLAFERRVRFRPPVWLGNLLLGLGTLVLIGLIPVAIELAGPDAERFFVFHDEDSAAEYQDAIGFVGAASPALAGFLLLVAGTGLSVTVHVPAHWLAGRLAGMRFVSYFLDGPFRIQPGIKVDYATYLRAPPRERAQMHAAGALASKAAPFGVFAGAYVVHWQNGWALFPGWSLWGLLAFGVVQVVTDVVWSTRASDWKKYRREKAVEADLYSRGEPGSSDAPG